MCQRGARNAPSKRDVSEFHSGAEMMPIAREKLGEQRQGRHIGTASESCLLYCQGCQTRVAGARRPEPSHRGHADEAKMRVKDAPFCHMTPSAFLTMSFVSSTINRKLTGKTS
jgi:hypothetical protein